MRPLILFLLAWLAAPGALAHTLGVDKADLIERPDGSYHLVSRVPPKFQPLITTVELPARCQIQGSPRGERGTYEVRYVFTCASPLVAGDEILLPWQCGKVVIGPTADRDRVALTSHGW